MLFYFFHKDDGIVVKEADQLIQFDIVIWCYYFLHRDNVVNQLIQFAIIFSQG